MQPCNHVTLLQLFHGGTLSIHWDIAKNFKPTFSIAYLFHVCLTMSVLPFPKISDLVNSGVNTLNENNVNGFKNIRLIHGKQQPPNLKRILTNS